MRKNKHLLLWSSLGTLLVLGWAAYTETARQEWRGIQREYRATLPPEQAANYGIQLRQVYVPAMRVTDRCVSCHVGMAPGEPGIRGHARFGPHPDVAHDPARFGCTTCHGGQGLATAKADAHGTVHHWPAPMIPAEYSYAGCGTCHAHLQVTNSAALETGRTALERYDCLACHALDGRGGTLRPGGSAPPVAPDLSRAGAVGYRPDWYEDHLRRRDAGLPGPWASSFAPIPAEDVATISRYLDSRSGAPGLVEAKALFHSLGCRGCHAVHGVGGDDGPDLTRVGQKDPGQLGFSHVPGERSLANWLAEHFRSPGAVVPGSAMPVLGLTESQIDGLLFYMLSLRETEFPEAFWPKDRIRAQHLGEREFATDGATLYGTFCAACHGAQGQGMRYPQAAAFPAIANPDFLALASDGFLKATVEHGRPGRRMPAWGELAGGLQPAEIDTVVTFVRQLGGGVPAEPDPREPRWARGDSDAGARLFAANCAGCHGANGEGLEGPALANPVLLANATDTFLAETIGRGRRGTAMPSFRVPSPVYRTLGDDDIEAIVTHIRGWEAQKR